MSNCNVDEEVKREPGLPFGPRFALFGCANNDLAQMRREAYASNSSRSSIVKHLYETCDKIYLVDELGVIVGPFFSPAINIDGFVRSGLGWERHVKLAFTFNLCS